MMWPLAERRSVNQSKDTSISIFQIISLDSSEQVVWCYAYYPDTDTVGTIQIAVSTPNLNTDDPPSYTAGDFLCAVMLFQPFMLTVDSVANTPVFWQDLGLMAATPVLIPVTVTQIGGSAGTSTTQCSFTYSVRNLSGTAIGAAVAPAKPRPALGAMTAGSTYGTAFYNGSTLVLWDAGEVPQVTTC